MKEGCRLTSQAKFQVNSISVGSELEKTTLTSPCRNLGGGAGRDPVTVYVQLGRLSRRSRQSNY